MILSIIGLSIHLIDLTFPFFYSGDCYVGTGRWYNGTVDVTKSNLPCQSWSVDYPQSHRRQPDIFLELENSENYCRNPGGDTHKPWCYVNVTHKRWEHCDIPKCSKLLSLLLVVVEVVVVLLLGCFFTSASTDSLSLKFEWQQVSSSLQDSSQYSGRSQ